jgi:hypothetical protein
VKLYLYGNGILFLALSKNDRSFQVGINPSSVVEITKIRKFIFPNSSEIKI